MMERPQSERVWRMRKQNLQVDAELRDHGEAGVDLQFFYNGELVYDRRCGTRAVALEEAFAKRLELDRGGWTSHW